MVIVLVLLFERIVVRDFIDELTCADCVRLEVLYLYLQLRSNDIRDLVRKQPHFELRLNRNFETRLWRKAFVSAYGL